MTRLSITKLQAYEKDLLDGLPPPDLLAPADSAELPTLADHRVEETAAAPAEMLNLISRSQSNAPAPREQESHPALATTPGLTAPTAKSTVDSSPETLQKSNNKTTASDSSLAQAGHQDPDQLYNDLAPGLVLNRLRLQALVRENPTQKVFSAQHLSLGRAVDLTILRPSRCLRDSQLALRLRWQGRVGAWLNHPQFLRVLDASIDDDLIYIAHEPLRGDTLEALISKARLAPSVAHRILKKTLNALVTLHSRGFTLRVLNPASIFVTEQDDIKITALEWAQALSDSQAALLFPSSQAPQLSPHDLATLKPYAAPELHLDLPSDARADLYGFGLLMLELLGSAPITHDANILHLAQTLRGGAGEVVKRLIASKPGDRFDSAACALLALEKSQTPSQGWIDNLKRLFGGER